MREQQDPLRLDPAPVPGEIFIDIGTLIRRHGAERPDDLALVDGELRMSWAEFAGAVNACAQTLRDAGLGANDVVASLARVSADHLVLYMGALAAGVCMAPLPLGGQIETLRAMAKDSGGALLFADAENAGTARALGTAPVHPVEGLAAARAPAPKDPALPAPGDLFDIIYSSGTTGTPKGIQHDHRFRMRLIARFAAYGYDTTAISLVSTPLYSNTTLAALLCAIAGGGTIVLMRKFTEEGFLKLAEAERVSHAMLVPVQYRRLLAHPDFDKADLSAFRVKLSTSSPLPPPVIRDALKRWPGRLINLYGMTEGGVSCILDCSAHPDRLDTVGKPSLGGEIRVLDAEGRELPQGEVGEVVGRSVAIMTGYRNAPDKTREAVWFSPEGQCFIRSGDLGRIEADGFVTLLDRKKDMIISGGFNIFAVDLETVISDHPEVLDVTVIGVPSERWGETPLALVVRRPGATIDEAALMSWANERLGKLQRLSGVEFRDSLPRSSIGKVLKRELREAYWTRASA